jgi:hypothetical protein
LDIEHSRSGRKRNDGTKHRLKLPLHFSNAFSLSEDHQNLMRALWILDNNVDNGDTTKNKEQLEIACSLLSEIQLDRILSYKIGETLFRYGSPRTALKLVDRWRNHLSKDEECILFMNLLLSNKMLHEAFLYQVNSL